MDRPIVVLLLPLLLQACAFVGSRAPIFDPPKDCALCPAWNAERAPYRIYGNTYYVGVEGLSAVLLTSPQGHVLIDGGLPQSAAHIDRNIRALGFRTEDVKLILNSHAHYDHAGGIAALQRLSGAPVATSALGLRALARGEPLPADPQHGFGAEANRFPPVLAMRAVSDGETLRVGALEITAHFTPGHTPGGTSWTWRACEAGRCLDLVYADSLTPVAAPGFRFGPDSDKDAPASDLARSIARVARLPCDILISAHPDYVRLHDKQAARDSRNEADAFLDPKACEAYAADAQRRLRERLEAEKGD